MIGIGLALALSSLRIGMVAVDTITRAVQRRCGRDV